MKFRALQVLFICASAATWLACGAGHPRITRLTVSPQTASAPISPPTDVQYTVTATFDNNTSRELTVADGLTFSTSDTAIATISDNGSASCHGVGPVTVTAKAPSELNITVNNGIDNTSPKVSGTAQLNCTAI
jgi:hypothetical protein